MDKLGRYVIVILLVSEFAFRRQLSNAVRLPSPDLSPREVVKIQVDSLRHWNEPTPNRGIWTTFQFASPANRRVTGPYGHFLRLIRGPENRPFLHAKDARFLSERRTGSSSEVVVELEDPEGARKRFTFSLSLQGTAPFKDCWMTDGVYPSL